MDTVQQANQAFKSGDYQTARRLYQQAAAKYGQSLFAVNIKLCDKALGQNGARTAKRVVSGQQASRPVTQPLVENGQQPADPSVHQQLNETQRLLEKYFARCQELEHQMMER